MYSKVLNRCMKLKHSKIHTYIVPADQIATVVLFIFSTQIELRQLQGLCRKYRAPEPEITACAPMGKLGVLYFQPSYTGRTFSYILNDFYSDTYVLGV